MYKNNKEKQHIHGFSLVEVLIVIGLVAILAATTIPIYGNMQVASQHNESIQLIVQALRQAREHSLAGKEDSSYGVYFEVNPSSRDKVIMYKGSTYASRDTTFDRSEMLESTLSLSTTLTNDEINFSIGLGIPSNTGAVSVTNTNSVVKVIDINTQGMVEER